MSRKKKQPKTHEFDLIASEFGVDPNEFDIVDFRGLVAQLKKFGLVSKKVDARRQKPTRYMRHKIREFADVLQGKAAVITVPKSEKAQYAATGHRVAGRNKAVVATPRGEKARRTKPVNGAPSYELIHKTPSGATVKRKRALFKGSAALEARLVDWVKKLPPLKKGESYAFRYRGYMSYQYFHGPDAKQQLIDYLMAYVPDDDAIDVDEEIMYFEFVTIDNPQAWDAGVQAQKAESRRKRLERNRGKRNEYFRRRYAEMTELERKLSHKRTEQTRKRDAEYQKKKRAQRTPEQIERDKAASKARMQKSRANRKKD